jgi:hypothetical protein
MYSAIAMARPLRGLTWPKPTIGYFNFDEVCYLTLETAEDYFITPDIKRVVVALVDPLLKGAQIQKWRDRGLNVHVGMMAKEAAHDYRGYVTRCLLGRPYISVMSKPATAPSERRAALQRAKVDAVITRPRDIQEMFREGLGHVIAEGCDMPVIDEALMINVKRDDMVFRNTDRMGPDLWHIYHSAASLALERGYLDWVKTLSSKGLPLETA